MAVMGLTAIINNTIAHGICPVCGGELDDITSDFIGHTGCFAARMPIIGGLVYGIDLHEEEIYLDDEKIVVQKMGKFTGGSLWTKEVDGLYKFSSPCLSKEEIEQIAGKID